MPGKGPRQNLAPSGVDVLFFKGPETDPLHALLIHANDRRQIPMTGADQGKLDDGKDFGSLVSKATEHAKERQEAIAAPDQAPRARSPTPLLLALAVMFLGILAWNVWFFTMAGEPRPEFEAVALQATVYLAIQAIEGEVEETGTLPASLEEVGADEEGLVYTLSGDGYTLSATGEHGSVEYRSGDPETPFQAAFQRLLAGEVRR